MHSERVLDYSKIYDGELTEDQQIKLFLDFGNTKDYKAAREEFLKEISSDKKLLTAYRRISLCVGDLDFMLFIVHLSHRKPNEYKKFGPHKVSFNSMIMNSEEILRRAKYSDGDFLCLREYSDFEEYSKMHLGIVRRRVGRTRPRKFKSIEVSDLEQRILNAITIRNSSQQPILLMHDYRALSYLRTPLMVLERIPVHFGTRNKQRLVYKLWAPEFHKIVYASENALKSINSKKWRHQGMRDLDHVKKALRQSRVFS